MINVLIKGILTLITWLVNLVLTPINLLFNGLFPTSIFEEFTDFLDALLSEFGYLINYLISYIPPHFYTILRIYIVFLVDFYVIYFSYLAITKLWDIIRKIKFW